MTQTYATGKFLYLTAKLSPGGSSFIGDRDLGITKGRLKMRDPNNPDSTYTEWIEFNTVVAVGDGTFTYGSLVRQLSQTADPATSLGTGNTWVAGTEAKLVAMHDQMTNAKGDNTYTGLQTYTQGLNMGTLANDAAADAAWGGTAPNGVLYYSTAAGSMRVKESGVWTGGPGAGDWASTRNVTAATAATGEFVRASDDSNNLHYKDNGGVDRTLLVNSTGKLATGIYDFATTGEMITGTDTTKPANAAGVMAAINSESGSINVVAGETIAAGKFVRMGYINFPGETVGTYTTNNSTTGLTGGIRYSALVYRNGAIANVTVGGSLTSLSVRLQKVGAPTGTLNCKIYTDPIPSSFTSSSTLFATANNTIDVSTISTSETDYVFNFTAKTLPPGRYYVVFDASYADSTTNYIRIATATGSGMDAGILVSNSDYLGFEGSAGLARCISFTLAPITTENIGRAYLANADVTANGAIGVAATSGNAGDTISVKTSGVATISGLTAGTFYYIDNAGGVTSTPNGYPAGRALTTTTLLLTGQNNQVFAKTPQETLSQIAYNGSSNYGSRLYYTFQHGLGVIPKSVSVKAIYGVGTGSAAGQRCSADGKILIGANAPYVAEQLAYSAAIINGVPTSGTSSSVSMQNCYDSGNAAINWSFSVDKATTEYITIYVSRGIAVGSSFPNGYVSAMFTIER